MSMNEADVSKLQDAVKTEVDRDRQRIISDAEAQAKSIRDQAQAEAEAERDRVIQEAEAKAKRLKQEAVGAAQLEAQAIRTRKRESLLDQVFAQASEQLSDASDLDDYGEIVERLVQDGAEHLSGRDELIVMADPKAREVLDEATLQRLSDAVGSKLTLGDPLQDGVGVVLQTADGRLRYDNTLSARLGRMRSSLRPPVYRMLMGDES